MNGRGRKMPLKILREDITRLRCDAVVNPTDPFYSGSSGTDRIGIAEDRAANYHADPVGTGALYNSVSKAVSAVRFRGRVETSWCEDINEDNIRRRE